MKSKSPLVTGLQFVQRKVTEVDEIDAEQSDNITTSSDSSPLGMI